MDEAERPTTGYGLVRYGLARSGMAWLGVVWLTGHGMAWLNVMQFFSFPIRSRLLEKNLPRMLKEKKSK